MTEYRTAWLQIHFCVLLWGFTAILGRLISIDALPLVLWRMGLVAMVLLLLPRVWRALRDMPGRLLAGYLAIGVLVSLHWLTFYGAIKLANASVAVTCIATVPVFLSIVEPVLTGRRFLLRELLLALLVVPGVVLLVGGTPPAMNTGIVVGIISAFFVSLFSSLNKRLVFRADSLTVTGLEMGAGALFLALIGLWVTWLGTGPLTRLFVTEQGMLFAVPSLSDSGWLLLLAFGCTLLPFALSLVALRQLSAYATALAVNLEPVYAILMAMVFLGEQQDLAWTFYAGAGLILLAVFAYPALEARRRSLAAPDAVR
ncbi:MAG: EamA family transporter [Pseudomonadota bacterium]